MNNKIEFAKDLVEFIHKSPSQFHVVKNIQGILEANSFKELMLDEKWKVEKNGKYFAKRNDSTIVAFTVGEGKIEDNGFKIIGVHTDSPAVKIKPNPEMVVENSYVKLNAEIYGAPILNTWLDRPLSMAGRASLKDGNNLLFNIERPIVIIPNVGLHMNRKVNEGIELNKQKDMVPLVCMVNDDFDKNNFFNNIIASELNIDANDIYDYEIYLNEYEKGSIVGYNEEFISVTKIDNLSSVHAAINGLIKTKTQKYTNVLVCFDNEEVGNKTKQGADSPFLSNILERISICLDKTREEYIRSIYKSFFISCDQGHAVHPNQPEKHDPTTRSYLNKGLLIKNSASFGFVTDSDSYTHFKQMCESINVSVQRFISRSDLQGGSTLASSFIAHLDMKAVDIGIPILAMHSIRELCGVDDHHYLLECFEQFYNAFC